MMISKKFYSFLLVILTVLLILIVPARAQNYTQEAEQHYRLGEIYYERGLYGAAENEFLRALELFEKAELLKSGKKTILEEKEPQVSKEKPQKEQPPEEPKPKEPEPIKPVKKEDKQLKEPRAVEKPKKARVKEQPAVKEIPQETLPRTDYIISPGDVLQINVWENQDLSQEAIVRPDGKISFPLIDEVQAEGRTILELDKDITERLKEFIRFPDVSISLKSMGGSKVVVLGEVDEPGVYSLTGRRTILEAISLAGGLTSDAYASSVVVIKDSLSTPKPLRISLNKAIHNPRSRQNIILNPEDIVFVPKKFVADLRYFTTQIIGPLRKGYYTKGVDAW